MKSKNYLKKIKSFFSKLYTRFSNYKNTKKWFVVYLVVLTFFLFFFPVVEANGNHIRFFLFSPTLWKSTLVILIAIIGLFLRNLSISFKGWITKLCALREDEPLVDFLLLWIIVSVFIGVMDGVNVAVKSGITQKIGFLNVWLAIDGLLLLGGLIWSFISLRKSSSKASKRTKIINIVEENRPKTEPSQHPSQVTHLFDDLNEE